MSYDEQIAQARASLARGEWLLAYGEFGKAHGLGHDVRRQHIGAHQGMLRAAWAGRSIGRAGTQLVLLTAAYIFERDRDPAS